MIEAAAVATGEGRMAAGEGLTSVQKAKGGLVGQAAQAAMVE